MDPQFENIEKRFDQVDQRFETMDHRIDGLNQKVDLFKEEMIYRFHVISEKVIWQVKLAAKGVMNLDEKSTREISSPRKENEQVHQETRP